MLAIITGYRPLENDKILLHVEGEEKGTFGLRTASIFTDSAKLSEYGADVPTQYIGTAVHIYYSPIARKWRLRTNRKEN